MGRLKKMDPRKICPACGMQMFRKQMNRRLEDRSVFIKRIYCNRKCMVAGMTQDKPTLSALRKRAEKLRGRVCEECGTQNKLHIHHLDMKPANNEAKNLMTLCASCHASWHWNKGKHRELISKGARPCSVCGKEWPKLKLGMCQKHYQRFKKYGDPLLTKKNNGGRFVLQRETLPVPNGPASPE